MTDPFAGPAPIPSTFPVVESFRGRLVLISPKSQKTVPNNLGNPGDMQEQVTADITVVDGQGPVPLFKNRAATGQTLPGPDFPGTYLSQQVIVTQLQDALRTHGMVLGRIDTKTPGTMAVRGNPWGIIAPTEEDKNIARAFLANRMVSGASAPAPVSQPVTPPVAAVAVATNPFAASAPAAQTPGVNPFAPEQ